MMPSKHILIAEIWHIPGLTLAQNKSLKFTSANALRLCVPGITIINTHTEIHNLSKWALPANVCLYRHVIMLYKLMPNKDQTSRARNLTLSKS